MTSAHEEGNNREELLLKLLTGEIDPKGEAGRKMLESDPDLHKEYDEVQALPQELDGLAAEEAAALGALSKDLPASPAVDKALKTLQHGKPRHFSILIPSILTAAAVIVIGISLWIVMDGKKERPIEVLGGDFDVVHTTESVDRHEFKWDAYPLSRGEEFYLFIDTGQGEVNAWHGKENSWTPSPEEAAELPDEITWWVEVSGFNADYPTASSKKSVSRRK